MKIHYISGSSFPSEISHTLSKLKMCQAFSDAGHKVLFTGVDSKHSKSPKEFYDLSDDFTISLQSINFLWDNLITRKLKIKNIVNGIFHARKLKKFKPDIVYSRLTLFELLFLPKDIPIIYEMHSLGYIGKGTLSKVIFKFILKLKNFKKIIVSSNALAKLLKKYVSNIEIIVARLSAENPIKISEKQLEAFKKEYLKGENFKHNVGYTGYLDTIGLRGTDIICKTASLMPEVAFHIVGGKPDIVAYWVDFAEKYNQHQNIFFYGYRSPTSIPFYLNCFDVGLAPLQHRPEPRAPLGANMSPLKLPQYMAYKMAMVVSDLNAHREILTQDTTALFVEHNNVEQWKQNIQKLLFSPLKREEMGENCYNEYLKNFTPSGRVTIILNGLNA